MKKSIVVAFALSLSAQALSQRVVRSSNPGAKPGKVLCQIVADSKEKWQDKFVYLDGRKPFKPQDLVEVLGPFTFHIYVMDGGGLILQALRTGEQRHFVSATGRITDDITGAAGMRNPSVRLENYGETASISCGDIGYEVDPAQN